ncbi:TrkH-domain-containing protein [Colletotrichum caudatum]|nr:TrkH-domain-containing protein [Colletotrichum caudatum]
MCRRDKSIRGEAKRDLINYLPSFLFSSSWILSFLSLHHCRQSDRPLTTESVEKLRVSLSARVTRAHHHTAAVSIGSAMAWKPWEKFKADHPAKADRVVESWAAVRPYLPPVNFITLHYTYFTLTGLLFAGIFHGLSHPANSISFIDSLFLVISAFTTSGLNTVDISKLSTAQQVIMALMMVLGSPVFVSIFTIWLRARVFEKRFEDIVEAERNRRIKKTGAIVGMAGAMIGLPVMSSFKGSKRKERKGRHERQAEADAFQLTVSESIEKGHGRSQGQTTHRDYASSPGILEPIEEGQKLDVSTGYTEPLSPRSNATTRRRPLSRGDGRQSISEGFDFKAFIHENKQSVGRNGQFFDLSEEQREYLGGVEYRALKILFTIVCVYFALWQLFGAIALGAWSYAHSQSVTAVNSQNSWWAGIFLAVSSFNNAGMTLLDAGVAAFDDDAFVLTVVTVLSLAGNAAFPAFLRATVYFCSLVLKVSVDDDEYTVWKEAFDFILKYPRRLYMMMFPAEANLVFVTMFSAIAVMDWVLLLVLSIGNSAIEAYPVGKRVGLALFQALTIPSGGFAVVPVSSLYFDVLVLWVIVMYISAYPEIIVMRNSNVSETSSRLAEACHFSLTRPKVYEERSLGIYTTEPEKSEDPDSTANESTDDLLPTFGPLSSRPTSGHAPGPERRPISASGVSLAKSGISARPVQRIAAIGRRGTSFVGKQIQSRMNDFQGVGVTAKPQLKRSAAIDFGSPHAAPGPTAATPEGHVSLVSQHLRGQLSHDIWAIALALFVITLIETSHSIADPRSYSVFNFLFEIVSGYTNIGLSIGLPDRSFSFAGGWYTGSKLVMIVMMIRGRHRGLPVALDHAVKLPGWDNVKKQDEDAEIRRSLGKSRTSLF